MLLAEEQIDCSLLLREGWTRGRHDKSWLHTHPVWPQHPSSEIGGSAELCEESIFSDLALPSFVTQYSLEENSRQQPLVLICCKETGQPSAQH